MNSYKEGRIAGDKEHRRATDATAGSISPQKLYGVPVGLMFFEGAPRLLASGVSIPHLHAGDPQRIAIEAYPGVLARQIIGRRSYKSDSRKKQTADQHRPASICCKRSARMRLSATASAWTHQTAFVTIPAPIIWTLFSALSRRRGRGGSAMTASERP